MTIIAATWALASVQHNYYRKVSLAHHSSLATLHSLHIHHGQKSSSIMIVNCIPIRVTFFLLLLIIIIIIIIIHYPSSPIDHPSSSIPHRSSIIRHPSSIIHHCIIPYRSSFIDHPSCIIPHQSIIQHPSSVPSSVIHHPSSISRTRTTTTTMKQMHI